MPRATVAVRFPPPPFKHPKHPVILIHPWRADDVLDTLLDQENLEVDPLDRLERDTPLHKAVRFINSLAPSDWPSAHSIADLLIDAGADPRIRNKAKLKPVELVDPKNTELRSVLQKAEYSMTVGDDIVVRDGDNDEGPTGSASDSE